MHSSRSATRRSDTPRARSLPDGTSGAELATSIFCRSIARLKNSSKSSVPLPSASYLLSTAFVCIGEALTPSSRRASLKSRIARAPEASGVGGACAGVAPCPAAPGRRMSLTCPLAQNPMG
eukprot:scaffold40574_cov27-Tisochrysis_lutea.AAC.9